MSVKFYTRYILVIVFITVSEVHFNSARNITYISGPRWSVKSRFQAYNLTSPSAHPYAVLIISTTSDADGPQSASCSGTIVTKMWVLTVAHCIKTNRQIIRGKILPSVLFTQFVLYAGGSNIDEVFRWFGKPPGSQTLWANLAIFHLRKTSRFNDVAIIRAPSPGFKFNDVVKMILMALHPYQATHYYKCYVTGFGSVYDNREHHLDGIRKTQELEIININREWPCQENLFRQMKYCNPRKYLISSKPEEGVGTCTGDSGAGLICNGDLQGVASFLIYLNLTTCSVIRGNNNMCGTKNTLSFFFDTCQFASWIVPLIDDGRVFYPRLYKGHDCWNTEHHFGEQRTTPRPLCEL